MSHLDQERWEQIILREDLGESILPEDRAFRAAWEESHPDCQRERDGWARMVGTLAAAGDPPSAAGDERIAAAVLAATRARALEAPFVRRARPLGPTPGTAQSPSRASRSLGFGLGAGLAIAASAALWFALTGPRTVPPFEPAAVGPASDSQLQARADPDSANPPNRTGSGWVGPEGALATPGAGARPTATATDPRVSPGDTPGLAGNGPPVVVLLLISGTVEIDGRLPEVALALLGTHTLTVDEGRACLRMTPSGGGAAPNRALTVLCLGAKSSLHIDVRDPIPALSLLRGHAALAIDGATTFTLDAASRPSATVAASDAVLGLVQKGTAGVALEVLEGAADWSAGGASLSLHAGDRTSGIRVVPLGATQVQSTRALLAGLDLWRAADLHATTLASEPHAAASIDGVRVGRTPFSIALPEGEHPVLLEAPRHSTGEARIHVGPRLPPPGVVRLTRTRAPTSGTRPVDAAPAPDSIDVQSYLTRIRAARAARQWAEAAALYRDMIGLHPRDPLSLVAWVDLGNLQREKLGDYLGALAAYEAYLARGGDLSQEAQYGRIRTLQALGRTDDERAAIEGFLQGFPQSLRAGKLRERAAALHPGR